jgi:hypothetical protein
MMVTIFCEYFSFRTPSIGFFFHKRLENKTENGCPKFEGKLVSYGHGMA